MLNKDDGEAAVEEKIIEDFAVSFSLSLSGYKDLCMLSYYMYKKDIIKRKDITLIRHFKNDFL